MNYAEYEKVKTLSYYEYCDYLQKKYGIGKSNYFFHHGTRIQKSQEQVKDWWHIIKWRRKLFGCPHQVLHGTSHTNGKRQKISYIVIILSIYFCIF